MKYLLMALLTMGCGADPDDYKVQKSDGCPSEGCPQTTTEPVTEPVTEEKTPAKEATGASTTNDVVETKTNPEPQCSTGKLCRGMSKSSVLGILGEPETVRYNGYGFDEQWEYAEDEPWICLDRWQYIADECRVRFKDGKLFSQLDIQAKWIDLENF